MQPLVQEAPDRAELSCKIKDILLRSGAYDRPGNFIIIDNIWSDPAILREFSTLVADYIRTLDAFKEGKIKGLIAIDKIRFPFGCVPIAALIAVHLSLPLAIWKENANLLTGASHVFGLREKRGLLLLHDVTERGLTPIRVALDLYENYQCIPRIILTIVDREQGAEEFILKTIKAKTEKNIDFHRILTLRELRES